MPRVRAGIPVTFWLGLAVLLALEMLLAYDVYHSHRDAPRTQAEINAIPPTGDPVSALARWVAVRLPASVQFSKFLTSDTSGRWNAVSNRVIV